MKRFSLLLLLLVAVISVFAVPARRAFSVHRQSDGADLYITVTGDETFHYYTTIDGVPVVKGENGDYYYAAFTLEEGFLSTGCIAHNEGNRSFEELQIIDINEFAGIADNMAAKAKAARRSAPARAASVSTMGVVNVPVLLVEYSDVKFTFTKDVVSDYLNKENYEGYDNPIAKSIGSAKDYFIAQSDGKFIPNFVVTDIVTLPNTMAYYGGNNASGSDTRPGHMIADGLKAADDNLDFSIFDNDGDGVVEFVYCIYAGYGENVTGNDESTIWPHQWELSATTGTKTFDGVKFNVYACSNELAISEEFSEAYGGTYLSGIGTMCHEFSHCLGLPDLYDTSSNGTGMSTFGYWDLMDSGSYTAEGYIPTGYSAYERDFMGWRALEVLDKKGDYSMTAITSGGHGYKIINDANSNEYYILENRKQEGWDKYLFGAGMLISHVDYDAKIWDNNTVNNTKSHLRLSLVPADNEILEYDGTNGSAVNASYKGDVWPGTSGNTEFTDTSVPAAMVFTGGHIGKPVTNITAADGVVSFSFMRGIVSTPEILPATDITENGFTANWQAVEDATEYIVELEKFVQLSEGEGDPVALLSEDFVGCTESNELILNLDNYTSVSGWMGSKLYGESGVMRIGTSSSAGTLKTPYFSYSGAVTVSFSMSKYNPNDTGAILTVSLVNAIGVAVSTETFEAATEWEDKEIEFETPGRYYIEFSTVESTGKKRVNIDNVVVAYKSSSSATLIDRVTTEDVSYSFTGLESGEVYRYKVAASDGFGSSEFSAWEYITLPAVKIYAVKYVVDGVEFAVDSVACGSEIVLRDEPVKEGYTFSGWSDAPAVMPASDVVIEGGFAVNSYIVTFVIDGEVYETITVEYGANIELPTPPEKEGYTFNGWSSVPATMPATDVVIEGSYSVDTTGINLVKTDLERNEVYDMNGRRIVDAEYLTRGVYIINGKKVLVK